MNPWILVPALAALALVFVMLPVGWAVYSRYRSAKRVVCPVSRREATILVDATQAGLGAAVGVQALGLRACSLLPERMDCGQECLKLPERDLVDVPRAA